MSLELRVRTLVENACSRDILLAHYNNANPQPYAQASEDCKVAVQLLKAIICPDPAKNGKLYVHATSSGQFRNFQDSIGYRCEFVSEYHQLQGLEPKHLVVIGTAMKPVSERERMLKHQIYSYCIIKRITVWEIEDWR